MKHPLISSLYLSLLFLPTYVFAHGGEEDGHVEEVVPPSGDERLKVAIGIAVITFLAVVAWMFLKRKRDQQVAGLEVQTDGNDTNSPNGTQPQS